MAPPGAALPQVAWGIRPLRNASPAIAPTTPRWKTADPSTGTPKGSFVSNRSGCLDIAAIPLLRGSVFYRLRDDADVGDPGALHGIHHRSEGSEGHAFIGTQINDLLAGVAPGHTQPLRQIVDVHRLI